MLEPLVTCFSLWNSTVYHVGLVLSTIDISLFYAILVPMVVVFHLITIQIAQQIRQARRLLRSSRDFACTKCHFDSIKHALLTMESCQRWFNNFFEYLLPLVLLASSAELVTFVYCNIYMPVAWQWVYVAVFGTVLLLLCDAAGQVEMQVGGRWGPGG